MIKREKKKEMFFVSYVVTKGCFVVDGKDR